MSYKRDLLGVYSGEHGLTTRPIEKCNVEWRLKKEREYQLQPEQTHRDLVYRGYWLIAAQLKIDYEAGRLQ
jgi:hypothetical protein